MNEKTDKDILLPSQAPSKQASRPKSTVKTILYIGLLVLVQCLFWKSAGFDSPFVNKSSTTLCPQAPELVPQKNGKVWQHLSETFSTSDFKTRAIDWLGDAVRIP
jgi:Gly-Xaa carboxypeptidase